MKENEQKEEREGSEEEESRVCQIRCAKRGERGEGRIAEKGRRPDWK